MLYFVYAIKSQKVERIYVGFSSDINRRILEHNSGYVFSTKAYRPWKLIYLEDASSRKEARTRELFLKSGVGKALLKSISE